MAKIIVDKSEITILEINEKDYISLTDMVRNIENGSALIEKWLRNKNTIEFLGIWEEMYNPNFNYPEFEGIKLNSCHSTQSESTRDGIYIYKHIKEFTTLL